MWLRIFRHAIPLDDNREKYVLLLTLKGEKHEKDHFHTEHHAARHGIKRLQHNEGNGAGYRKRWTKDGKRCGKVKVNQTHPPFQGG